MAPLFKSIILAGLALVSDTVAVRLLGTHFSGQIYTFDLTFSNPTTGSIAVTSKTTGCGVTPTWLYLDQESKTVYCFDESWTGSGVLSQYKYDPSKGSQALTLSGQAKTPGNSVHGSLYGGKDGKSFVITSE
jgi:6-phosphogluconolactonase (cycloisomerase 2 family)